MLYTHQKTLWIHRALLAFMPLAVIIGVSIAMANLLKTVKVVPFFIMTVCAVLIIALPMFQYIHQAYLAIKHVAIIPLFFFFGHTFCFISYVLLFNKTYDFLDGEELMGFHAVLLIGYFIYHHTLPKAPIE